MQYISVALKLGSKGVNEATIKNYPLPSRPRRGNCRIGDVIAIERAVTGPCKRYQSVLLTRNWGRTIDTKGQTCTSAFNRKIAVYVNSVTCCQVIGEHTHRTEAR